MGKSDASKADLTRLAYGIAKKLAGLDLLHADLLVDQARRLSIHRDCGGTGCCPVVGRMSLA